MVQRVISGATRGRGKNFIFRPSDRFVRATLAAASLIGILVITLSMARADDSRSQARAACEADYRRICAGVLPGSGRVRKCLTDNFEALSDPCKQVVSAVPAK
jgi:hypothetical protein